MDTGRSPTRELWHPIARHGSVLEAVFEPVLVFVFGLCFLSVSYAGEPLFTSAYRSLDVGVTPRGVALGDLDGDGNLDLAVAHQGRERAVADSVVSLYRGDGHGGFVWDADYATGADPQDVAIHDLDQDGKLDVIVACRGSHSIVTWFGVGEGVLGRARRFATGLRPTRFAIEDFDGDGGPDVAVVQESSGPPPSGIEAAMIGPLETLNESESGSVSFLVSDPESLLKQGPRIVTGHSPVALAVGHLDGDTHVDVAVANQASSTISILAGRDPAFATLENVRVSGRVVDVVIGDWDGDGRGGWIAAVTSQEPGPGTNLVFAAGQAGKVDPGSFWIEGRTLARLGLVDLDQDGRRDLLALGIQEVLTFPRSNSEQLETSVSCKIDSRPAWLATGRLNTDPWPDLVTSSNGFAVSILLGNGDGTFGMTDEVATGPEPSAVTATDPDGDGRMDLAVTNEGSGTVSFFHADPQGGFGPKVDYEVGDGPRAIESQDVDGDGIEDLVVLRVRGASSEISMLRGRQNGTFEPRVRLVAGADPAGLLLEDVNRDDRVDLIVPKASSEVILLYLATDDGTYDVPNRIPLEHLPSTLAAGDLNGDDRVDFVAADSKTRVVTVLLGRGDATFDRQSQFRLRMEPGSLAIRELTGDDVADLLIGPGPRGDVGSVLTGQGDGTFGKRFDFETGPGSGRVTTADVDGDEVLDLVVARRRSNVVSVLSGLGDGQFSIRQDYATGSIPSAVCVTDLDGDDRPDLAVTNLDANTLSLLWNRGQ